MDFFENFGEYIFPLNPLAVIICAPLFGAIGGALVATQSNKKVGKWAARSAALLTVGTLVGAHIGSTINGNKGGGLPGLIVGGIVAIILLNIFVIASKE